MVKPLMTPYTNTRGQHPFHISTTEYFYLMGFSWAFRKGAPFRHRFAKMIQRLIEAGLVNQWLEDVLARKKSITGKVTGSYQMVRADDAGGLIVLSIDHLQGAFYILIMGSCLASLALVAECLVRRRCSKETQQ
nr:uncharacterized protein LOC128704141 [Cherax quadricarinatus]